MALKEREKMMVGFMMIAGGLAILIGLGGAQWDGLSANMTMSDDLKREIEGLNAQKTLLNASIGALSKKTGLTEDMVIRKYTPDTLEENIKAMVDQVVNEATSVGNRLILLEPYAEDPLPVENPNDKNAKKDDQKTGQAGGDGTQTADGENKPEAPPPPQLNTFGYQLAVRGNYNSIQDFLKSLDKNKELVEVKSIKIENEAGADRATQSTSLDAVPADPTKPIKLTAKLKLVLQPE